MRREAEGKVCLEWRMAACGAGREEGGLSVKSTPYGERGAPGPQPHSPGSEGEQLLPHTPQMQQVSLEKDLTLGSLCH